MGNPGKIRCPHCGSYGNAKLNGLCRRCDNSKFRDDVYSLCNGSQEVLWAALREFKVAVVDDLSAEQKVLLKHLIKRRQPKPRRGHIAQPKSFFEDVISQPESYGIEKRRQNIEGVE